MTEVAENGEEAVRILQSLPPETFEVVLMDLQMPGVDGLEATRRIRAMERDRGRPGTPIIALSAAVGDAVSKLCREAGVDQLFIKPASSETLADMGPDNPRVEQFCTMLSADIREELQRLATALADGNRQVLKEAAHTLKGLCGHLRDPLPAEQAVKIRYGSKNVPLDELTAYVTILQQQLQDICPEGS